MKRNRLKETAAAVSIDPVAWRVGAWCAAIGCCQSHFFANLLKRGGIDIVKVGRMTLVTTSPAEYLRWAAAAQPQTRRRGRLRRRDEAAVSAVAEPAE